MISAADQMPVWLVMVLGITLCVASWAQAGSGGPTVEIDAATETDGAHAGATVRAVVQVAIEQGWHVNAHKPLEDYLIPTTVELDPSEGVTISGVIYPKPEVIASAFAPEGLAVYGGTVRIGLVLALADAVPSGTYTQKGRLRYQACTDTQCFAPATKEFVLPLVVRPRGEMLVKQDAERFAGIDFAGTGSASEDRTAPPGRTQPAAVAASEGHWRDVAARFEVVAMTSGYQGADAFLAFLADGPRADSKDTGGFAGRSLWAAALLALVGGLALNLTPCVLPFIPINLGIIGAGAQSGPRGRGFVLGALYGLGIATVYGALGLVVVLGLSTTFGALNAKPGFNGAVAAAFIVLGLAMFDVLVIDFSRFQAKLGVKKKTGGRFLLAVFMGGVSALLAGACVAPVVISTVVYAQDQFARGVSAALALPFLLGVGMALPWPFAGAGLSFLPKPGIWMVRVKHAFGVFIFLFAAYYGYLAVTLATADTSPTLAEGLARAERERKPVLLDFWATWCKNCTTMDRTTFKNAEVQAALDDYVIIKYQAENPDDPATREVLDHFDVIGLPTYVILNPKPAA